MSLADQQAAYYRDPDTGHLMMPGTKRPDGTWRKPRRIKEGYVPQEEVPLYESKGKQLAKAREANPIPGMPSGIFNMKIDTFDHKALMGPPKIPGLPDSEQIASNLDIGNVTNKKPNKKKKKTGSQTTSSITSAVKIDSQPSFQSDTQHNHNSLTTPDSGNVAADPAKKLRNLKKKLRDIENLEKKLADGSLINPEPEQLEKVHRKTVMLEELAQLEIMVANMST